MDVTTLLKSQHRDVKALFADYEKARTSASKERIFTAIADALAAHATIEEKIFYPAIYSDDDKALLKEAVEEHLSVKRIITDLLSMSPKDENFDAKVTVLKEQIEHHVKEEEDEIFEAAKQRLSRPERVTMGEEMLAMFEKLMAKDPRRQVPAETGEAAPLT